MRSWKLGEIAGIGVYIHWSFLILPLLIGGSALASAGVAAAVQSVLFVLAIFGCVLLHELGHALTARQFGIGTRSITLLPIGGVANLDRMPRKPAHELAVALAGPAVNVAIAAVLFFVLLAVGTVGSLLRMPAVSSPFLVQLLWANVALVIFNMLPAFPMDGGRVLRAILATFLPHARATSIAAGVGQVMAVLFAFVAFSYSQWTLLLIAVFIFFAGRAEAQMAQTQEAVEGWRVADAMRRNFHLIPAAITLQEIAPHLMQQSDEDFPVIDDNRLVGMLEKRRALMLLSQGRGYLRVSEAMREDVPTLDQQLSLEESIARMQTGNYSSMPVANGGRLVGILSATSLRNILSGWTMRPVVIDQ
jgi:Zn-dependent protease